MRVLHVNPILNVSSIAETISWFEKLGWTVGFEWHDNPDDADSPVEFASVRDHSRVGLVCPAAVFDEPE